MEYRPRRAGAEDAEAKEKKNDGGNICSIQMSFRGWQRPQARAVRDTEVWGMKECELQRGYMTQDDSAEKESACF